MPSFHGILISTTSEAHLSSTVPSRIKRVRLDDMEYLDGDQYMADLNTLLGSICSVLYTDGTRTRYEGTYGMTINTMPYS